MKIRKTTTLLLLLSMILGMTAGCGETVQETETSAAMELRLLTADEWESRVAFPTEATADVTLRRLQKCRFPAGAAVAWTCGTQNGEVSADAEGLVTIPSMKITADAVVLKLAIK